MHLLRDVEEHATISISAANTAAAALRLYSIWSNYGVEADEDAFKYGKLVLVLQLVLAGWLVYRGMAL